MQLGWRVHALFLQGWAYKRKRSSVELQLHLWRNVTRLDQPREPACFAVRPRSTLSQERRDPDVPALNPTREG